MKLTKIKKISAVALAAIMLLSVGCAKNKNTTIKPTYDDLKVPLSVGEEINSDDLFAAFGLDPDNGDHNQVANTDPADEPADTTKKATATTKKSSGNATTKAGETTPAGETPADPADTEPDTTEPAETEPEQDNKPSTSSEMKELKAFWLDMSKRGDYIFDGDIVRLQFKIKDTAKVGDVAKIEMTHTDFSNWGNDQLGIDPQTVIPDVINGSITVGDTPEAIGGALSNFTLYVNNGAGKPGDTVTVTLDLARNPGFVAFFLKFSYDASILEYVDPANKNDLYGQAFKAEM
jgi:hypothetical protein